MKSKIQQKIIILLLATIALFGTGLSCGGNKQQGGEITLNFWKPFDSSDKWQDIINAYQELRPNVRVVYTQKAAESYERDLKDAMAAGKGPDIFSVRNDWVPRYREFIGPMPDGMINLRTFQDTFVDAVVSDFLLEDGKVYGLTPTVDALALYYNKDHFASAGIARPPSTWPEFIASVPRLTQQGQNAVVNRGAIALGTSTNVNRAADILSLLMLQSGVEFYDPTFSQPELNGEAAQRTMRFYAQFSDPSSQAYTWNKNMDYSIDAFTQGKVSAILGYSYLMPTLEAKEGFLNYGVAGVPQINNQSKINFANYWAETVWTGSRNQNAAWDFILFANAFEQSKKYVEKTGLPSSRRDILSEQQKDPKLGPFADAVLSAQTVKKPEPAQFDKILTDLIDNVSLSGLADKDALTRAEQQLQTLMGRYPIRPRAN